MAPCGGLIEPVPPTWSKHPMIQGIGMNSCLRSINLMFLLKQK